MIILDEKELMEDIRNCCSIDEDQLHKIWIVISEHQMKAITEDDKLQSAYNKGQTDCSLQLIRDMQEEYKDYIERLISRDGK